MKHEEIVAVAAYCRVSTDREEQASSFENQVRFFRDYIAENPNWKLYEIYTDEGITGTNVKKREGFLRMIEDAKKGRFSLILTKEISRFARNLLDSVFYTRELKGCGVGVLFLNDGIDTRDGDAELRLAILSSIAQEESRRTSERVKWGQKRRMEAGVVFGRGLFGYDLSEGKLTVNEEEAATVRHIFHLFAEENMGLSQIARMLTKDGRLTRAGRAFTPSVLSRMLQNEKYCGDLVQKKTVTVDYLSHEKKSNRGEEALVILHAHHEPIVERKLFERTQALFRSRRGQKISGRESFCYPFSGKMVCGICGRKMTARVQKREKGIYHLWRCSRGHETVSVRNECVLAMLALVMAELRWEWMAASEALTEQTARLLLSEGTAEKFHAAKERLLSLYLMGEIEKTEFQVARDRLQAEEVRFLSMEKEIEALYADAWFYRALTEQVTVWKEAAQVKLAETSMSFFFSFAGRGKKSRPILLEKRK